MLDALRGLLQEISIHALREEGDASDLHKKRSGWYFYPRPPRGGRPSGFSRTLSLSRFLSTPSARRATSERRHWHIGQSLFLSTPSARRATTGRHPVQHRDRHFYPRPPRGGRRDPAAVEEVTPYFYPRPPRGGRQVLAWRGDPSEAFLSTPSARRATTNLAAYHLEQIEFLSTPSARRATPDRLGVVQGQPISIHALREEGDAGSRPHRSHQGLFLSTPSARRATDAELDEMAWELFLSTPSARRATG